MPVHAIEHLFNTDQPPVEIGVKLYGMPDGSDFEFFYADIPGQSWTPSRLAQAEAWVQDKIDIRTDRSTIDPDHPAIKDGDPGLVWLFWDGTDLVVRLMTFSDLAFDGEHSTFTLTKHSRREWEEAQQPP